MRRAALASLVLLIAVLFCSVPAQAARERRGSNALARPGTASAAVAGVPVYNGGPILQNAKVIPVLWDGWQYGPDVNGWGFLLYFHGMLGSSFITNDLNSQYGASIGKPIGAASWPGTYTINPAPSNDPVSVSDSSVRTVLTNQLNTGKLPGPGPAKLYVIMMPPGKTYGGAYANACAWHSSYYYGGANGVPANNTYYAVIPFEVRGCSFSLFPPYTTQPNFDNLTYVMSHEIIEAITDPAIGNAHGAAGWYPEIADPCEGAGGFWEVGTDGLKFWTPQMFNHLAGGGCVP
jgi:hypothetical protein